MRRFPAVEAMILRALEEKGEVSPPPGRLAEEYFWHAAAQLQTRGLCVADQAAGVVMPPGAPPFLSPRGATGPFSILVVWLDGEQEYLKEGRSTATFPSRKAAEGWREFMLEGMADEVQSINVVPTPPEASA